MACEVLQSQTRRRAGSPATSKVASVLFQKATMVRRMEKLRESLDACELAEVCSWVTQSCPISYLQTCAAFLKWTEKSHFSLESLSPSFLRLGETLASAAGQNALQQQLLLKNKNFLFLSCVLKSFLPPKNNTQYNFKYSLRHLVVLLFLRRLRIIRHEIPNKSQKQSNVIKCGRSDSQEREIDTTLLKSLEPSQLK